MRLIIIILIAAAILFGLYMSREGGLGPDTGPAVDPVVVDEAEAVEEEEIEPEEEVVEVTAPSLPHDPPGILQTLPPDDRGTARFNGTSGVTDPSVVSPLMQFPIESGPAFSNSQIFGFGGGGYGYSGSEVYNNPNAGQENDPRNFNYPWRDDFCEVRTHSLSLCAAGNGHQGQDIRPATCDNGAFRAVAPEDGFVRRVGETHLIEIYGDSGLVYKFLHIDRPLEPGIVKNARVTKGQPIGKVSNKTGATSRSTTVHLHLEIWHGTAAGGVDYGSGPLPPYSSLVEAYLDLIDDHPEQFDPVTPPVNVSECRAP
jgi:murein DD-endopeptidase MepM/ murein hydrolase activator NlpD